MLCTCPYVASSIETRRPGDLFRSARISISQTSRVLPGKRRSLEYMINIANCKVYLQILLTHVRIEIVIFFSSLFLVCPISRRDRTQQHGCLISARRQLRHTLVLTLHKSTKILLCIGNEVCLYFFLYSKHVMSSMFIRVLDFSTYTSVLEQVYSRASGAAKHPCFGFQRSFLPNQILPNLLGTMHGMLVEATLVLLA